VAISIAAGGVLYLILNAATLPWVGLTLAFSFGSYALLRKIAPLDSLEGLSLETLLLCVPGLIYLFSLEMRGTGQFGHAGAATTVLLVFTGMITAVPLLLFAAGARLITLSTLGVLQYVAPTIQFLIGVVLYGEALTPVRLIGFSLIWAALLLYALEGILERRREGAFQYAH
jgi:chloramphenicol-sensitive protein RarD